MSEWTGEGWYRIGWSDGGMDWTNNGPIWFDCERDFDYEMYVVNEHSTETHLPYVEYMGDDDEPKEQQ